MTEISGNPFACRSANWREGYEAGIAAFSTELSALKAKGLIAEAAEITRLTERCAALQDALREAEAAMSIIPPRTMKAHYIACLEKVRAALSGQVQAGAGENDRG